MKIGVDVRSVGHLKAGKGIYTFRIMKELLKADLTAGTKNQYILYTDKITAEFASFGNAHIKVVHSRPWIWHFKVMKDFRTREKGDLFFAPTSYIIPALLPKKIASVITVHDIVAFLHPQLHQGKAMIIEHLFFRMALKKARAVIVPSENTKRDLVRVFRYSDEKIHVTPLAADDVFFKKPDEDKAQIQAAQKKYDLPKKFILTVSGLEPRKNVGELIDAFEKIAPEHPETALVIVGGKGWKSDALQKRIAKVQADSKLHSKKGHGKILHFENVTFSELPALYKLATVFVYPSLYEGFGLPPLEAMASGCPVICSDAASLKEVVGKAALGFSPGDTNTLVHHLKLLLTDENKRTKLAQRGKKLASTFSWKKTAIKTLEIINAASDKS